MPVVVGAWSVLVLTVVLVGVWLRVGHGLPRLLCSVFSTTPSSNREVEGVCFSLYFHV